ncbi:protein PFC0760c-like isoform X3 [Adelges cooleyi]|uniref:protein PFC0760c-like isoform X3 n=1 Tax=Adelges cooleyi TaxID=133065 RepID=UPI00217FFEBF|nr:protein PFC0760c-like isoform X3 [Adelges cooleyi]
MHFISAVILCALYFVTVTQSIGLFKVQIKHIVAVFSGYKDCKNEIPMKEVLDMTKMMGVKNMTFEFKKDMNNNQNLQDLLVFLANSEKKTDRWTFRMLTSFEVQLLVSLFEARDRMGNNDGLLEYSEVLQVIDALVLESKVRMLLKAEFQEGDKTINAAEFLKGYLVAKKSGKGLDKKQVEELNNIKNHKKVDEHIDDVEITNFYKKLSIVKDEYNSLVDLKTTRTAPFVLQELMVNSSEYYYREIDGKPGYVCPNASIEDTFGNFSENSTEIDVQGIDYLKWQNRMDVLGKHNKETDEKAETVSSISSIDEGLEKLSELNTDKNGALGMNEPEGIAKHHCQNKDCDSIQEHHNNGNAPSKLEEQLVVSAESTVQHTNEDNGKAENVSSTSSDKGIANHQCQNNDCRTIQEHVTNGNVPLKLQDQLDILAELDKGADEEAENVSSITSLDEGLKNLSEHNTDKNGTLGMNEYEGIAKHHCQNKDLGQLNSDTIREHIINGTVPLKYDDPWDYFAVLNEEADENAVYTTTSVRDLLQAFAALDGDKSGGLNKTELIETVKLYCPNENVDSFIDKFDIDGNHILDILEFFGAAVKADISLMERYSDEESLESFESDEIDWSDDSDDCDCSDESDEYDWIDEVDWSDESDENDENDENDKNDENANNDKNAKNDENDKNAKNDENNKNAKIEDSDERYVNNLKHEGYMKVMSQEV